jgi:hypothetical protein
MAILGLQKYKSLDMARERIGNLEDLKKISRKRSIQMKMRGGRDVVRR